MKELKSKNFIFIFSGPSGVGKDTTINELIKNQKNNIQTAISTTTRKPRFNETNGVNYYFVTKAKFETMIKQNKFIEYVKYNDQYYGTLSSEIDRIIKSHNNIALVIDVVGMKKIVKEYKNKFNIVTFFLMPPSLEELEKRLMNRKTNSAQDIAKRMKVGKKEIKSKDLYDHIIVLKSLKQQCKEISDIIKKII
jgi:guanylate kinase